jgi:hypothetical protein
MKTEIISVFTKKEDIDKIIDSLKGLMFDEIEKHPHFEFSIMEKLTDFEILKNTFPKFELIQSIELRENEKKQQYSSLNYVLEDGTYVVISINLKGKPIIINGFHADRSYKQFEKSLRKNYSKQFV